MKQIDNTQYIKDNLTPGAYRLSDQGSVPEILLRGVMPATEDEMRQEMSRSGSVFLDAHGRIISPEFVSIDRTGRIYVDIERAVKQAQAATQQADNNRRWHTIEPRKAKSKPMVIRNAVNHAAGMPRPKLMTMNVWRALSSMGVKL